MIYISNISATGKIRAVYHMPGGIDDIKILGWNKEEKEKEGAFIEDEPEDFSVEKYLYLNGELIVNPDYTEHEIEEPTQDEINLDFDFRITCLELGL